MDKLSTHSLFAKWTQAIPALIPPFLSYIAASTATITQPPSSLQSVCLGACVTRNSTILCLFQDYTLQILIANGLFPTAPTQPCMAVSILLDFYHVLFERSCDAINVMASVLNTFYTCQGFILLNNKGQPIQDAFWHGLGYAIQWYDILQVHVEQQVESALQSADHHMQESRAQCSTESLTTEIVILHDPVSLNSSHSLPPIQTVHGSLTLGQCACILQQRCPACFAGLLYGRSSKNGADIQIAVDDNFNHQHLRSAGQCLWFYEPQYMLSKEQAVDECKSSHTFGSGSNSKTNMDKFDDGGLMALVCCHDIPLFLANINMPGEQQKYVATVHALYDVGCVLDQSLQLYEILPPSIVEWLMFATSAMHTYAHQWACQIVCNPRLSKGLGLTDGEGIECLWSHLHKLIGITHASAWRWIWLIDCQMTSIGLELHDDLGDWIQRQLAKGIGGHMKKAKKILDECGVSLTKLRAQWELQQASQLSIHTHKDMPSQLKKELDIVLKLQGDLDTVNNTIHATHELISKLAPLKESLQLLSALVETQEHLKSKVEALYASLNIHESFPELQGLDHGFVRTLLMAHDLKINIRKRAIGSFFEWDKLDQVAGSRDQALGMKLHQSTRKAISKCKPALMNAIRKFNKYCKALKKLYKPEWNIPLPEPLLTQLAVLCDSSILMEDVWVAPAHHWLKDSILKLDQCLEEQCCLGTEADNLCRWFGQELCAIELALKRPSNQLLVVLLQQKCMHLLNLKLQWTNPLASSIQFDAHVKSAETIACALSLPDSGVSVAIAPSTHIETDPSDDDDLGIDLGDDPDLAASESGLPESEMVILNDILLDEGNTDDPAEEIDVDVEQFDIPLIWSVPILFEPKDLCIMESPNERLNDICLNGIAATLHICVLFTTFDLPMIRYHASNTDICCNIWILPIHQTHLSLHWVLCKREIKEIMQLVLRLVLLANKNGQPLHIVTNEGWTAHPIAVHPMQTNSIDCGLWVLATIAAVLWGFHVTGIAEQDMVHFRVLLLQHLLILPVSS
ncbi:hypothetical protein L208DRAFT_1423974 [Tricholoma matsutake]|nr:hypothetical protein L208DRAFT_1423974 [Tricholoma matsutake 945]